MSLIVLSRAPTTAHERHLATLRRLVGRFDRRDYIDRVAKAEGQQAAQDLKAAYVAERAAVEARPA